MFKLKWKWCIPNYRLDGFAWVCSWSLNTEKGVSLPPLDGICSFVFLPWECHAYSHDSLWLFQGFISAWPFNPESVHKCAIIGIITQKSQQNCFAIERRSFSSCLIMDQKQKFQGLRRNHFNLQPSDSVHHCSTVGVLRTPWWAGP